LPEGIVNRSEFLMAIKSQNTVKVTPRGASRLIRTQQPESPIRSPETTCLHRVAFDEELNTRPTFSASKRSKQRLTTEPEGGPAWVMDLLPLSPNDFKCCFTLFSKYFSSFVHTTCSLSVSVQYLAFGGVHLRVCTAISNCATLGAHPTGGLDRVDKNGTIALHGETFQNASSTGHKPVERVLALQFRGFRFLPPRIQA